MVPMVEAAITAQLAPGAAVERAAPVIAGITGLPEGGARWPYRPAG